MASAVEGNILAAFIGQIGERLETEFNQLSIERVELTQRGNRESHAVEAVDLTFKRAAGRNHFAERSRESGVANLNRP